MPTERPRIQVTLDSQTSALLATFADIQERSLSSAAADLIKEALELHEDMALSKLADKRLRENKKWISHEEVWS